MTEERRYYNNVRVSPDGTRLAVVIQRADGEDVWVHDLFQATWVRLTSEGFNKPPKWSPDGRRLALTSNREGSPGLFWVPADGSAEPEPLLV